MDDFSRIKRSIRQIAGHREMLYVGRVKSVDGETCTVQFDDLTLSDVRLRAVVNGKESKMLITPACGSYVTVIDPDNAMTDLLVIAYSEIEKVEIDCDKVSFNGGENDGLIKITELTNKLNELVDAFNKHTHSGVITAVTGQAVGKPGNTGTPVSTAETFTKSDYEDEKVKH